MTTILPKFDFSDETEAKVDTTNKAHSSIREPHNALSPIVFNEYERVMELAAAAIGDPDFSDILAQNNTNIGSALREVYDLKFNVAGGTVTGSVTVNGALSSPQLTSSTTTLAPIIVNSNVMVPGLNVQYLNGHPAPVGDIVGTTDSQTLTNKTINGGNIIPPSSASPNQTTAGQLEWNSTLLKLTTGTGSGTTTLVDAESTQDISGVKTISDNLVLSGDNAGLVLRNDTDFRISAEDDQIRIHADSTGDGTFETSVFVADNSLETVSIYGKELITSYDNQIITGIKTFSTNFPVTPSTAPTTDYQMANKKYVDDISQGSLRHDIVINNQTEFDAVFTGTISENTSIFIKKKETPYLLNNAVVLSSNVRITSDGAIVNRGSATARFSTTYKNLTTYAGGGAIGETTFNRNAGVPFVAGDSIVHTGNKFYTVVSDTTTESVGGTVTISTPVKGIQISGSIYSCQHSIYTDGWIFDGQGNVNGLGPSTDAFTFDGNGGAFNLAFCVNSTFKAEVRNCALVLGGSGGAYSGAHDLGNFGTYNLIIENINNCSAGSIFGNGGGCHSCHYSTISNINNCSAATGGGCYECHHSTISNISFCSAGTGGGCAICHFSNISNISYCSATSNGGGCASCHSNNISNINNCSAGHGGGCYDCDYSTISNITTCSASSGGGGGCNNCDYSTISNINNCSAGSGGGGCASCNYCFFYGDWSNNNGPAPQNLSSCSAGIAFCTDGTAAAYTVTARGTCTY